LVLTDIGVHKSFSLFAWLWSVVLIFMREKYSWLAANLICEKITGVWRLISKMNRADATRTLLLISSLLL
jgi:hypothetical protein